MTGGTTRRAAGRTGGPLVARCLVVGITLAGCGCQPPRGLEKDHPGPLASARKPGGRAKPADNSDCLVCHMDFKTEVISLRHQKAGVGCTRCHGPSLAPGDDEMNITTPDRLFGRTEIAPFCKTCHATHKTGKVYDAFLRKWHSKRRPNGRMILDDSVCTDCHGNHAVLPPGKQVQ